MPAGKKAAARKNDENKMDSQPAAGTGSMREAAEKKLGELPESSSLITGETPEQLVHELQVHQIELEMQAEELRRAYHELGESRDRLLDLYDFAPSGYLTLTDKALIKDVNLAGALLLGLVRQKLAGARFRTFIARQDLEPWDRYFIDLLTHAEKKSCTLTLTRADGSAFPARLESIRITGSNGTYTVRIAINDITDIWQIKAIKESEERFRKIFENSPIGMALVMPDFRFFSVNPAWISMTGYSEKELLKMSFPDITHPDYRANDLEHIRELVAGTIPVYTTEKRYIRKDGSILWGLIRVTVICDHQGSLCYFAAQIEDISERKQAEVVLRELSTYNRSLIDASIDPLMTVSKDGKIQDVNIATEMATGRSRNELIGTDFSEYFTKPDKAREGYLRVFSEGKVHDYPLEIRHRDGHITAVLYNATVYRDNEGNIRGVFAAARDVTEQKRAEEMRDRSLQDLARKNAELDRFTYTVSHDLKSPLMTIRAFLILLVKDLESGNSERVQTDLLRMSESAEKLEYLITTLLALSRSGKTVDTFVRIPFTDLVRESARLLSASLQKQGVTLVIPENLPIISGDRQRLLQMMNNLLENAVKFMGDQKEPRVEVGVFTKAGTQVFFVKDNGIGFKKENLEKAFGLYERFNPEIPGSGIGLATVKRIIEAHGGTAWVESEGEGMGTKICFTLPGDGAENGMERTSLYTSR